uniref:F14J16.31 n=1 Tax=Arabidopsis thaliana TaxID=3702 RepID=Q9LG07_ARATH|nr:F14J16.31 [Arabidopsis thaliana]
MDCPPWSHLLLGVQKECKPMAATTISPAIRKQMSSVAVAMKVAVIGSGISGAVCASTLARNGVSVTIFDSGRGPGGRMSQRREIGEDGKELMFDHGAPFFCVSNSDAMALVHEWESRGFVSEWKQVFGSFDCASNKFLGIQQEGDAKKYVGVPGMNSISKALCNESGVKSMFGTGIAKMEWLEEEIPWLLTDSKGENLGRFDGVVASDKNIVSPRFTQVTGLPPPLGKTCTNSVLLQLLFQCYITFISIHFYLLSYTDLSLVPELATKLQNIPVLPCFSLMLAFKEPLSSIPVKGLSFKNSEILSWAHCESTKPGRSTDSVLNSECYYLDFFSERWILHSTPDYANSVIAKTGLQKLSSETLNKISEEMFKEFQCSGLMVSVLTLKPSVNLFASKSIAVEERCLWDRNRNLAICGDFCVSPNVEGAILSGLAAASKLLQTSSCL